MQSAKKVLAEGTPEEISAVQEGKAAVTTIARQIRANATPKQRRKRAERALGSVGKNPASVAMNATLAPSGLLGSFRSEPLAGVANLAT